MDNKAHRSLTEAYTTMITEETAAASMRQMLSCINELGDMLEGNDKTKDLVKKADSLERAVKKAFKEPKADDGGDDKPADKDKEEMEEGFQKDAEGNDNSGAKKDAKLNEWLDLTNDDIHARRGPNGPRVADSEPRR